MTIGTAMRGKGRISFINAASLAMVALILSPNAATAQQTGAQQAADALRRLEQTPAPLAAESAPPAPAPLPEGADKVVPVTAIALVGRDGVALGPEDGLPLGALEGILTPLAGASPTVGDIILATEALKARLRGDGFLFTSVSDAAVRGDGNGGATLIVAITGVTIDAVTVTSPDSEDASPAMFAALERIVRPLEGKRNPRLQDLERASLLASDISGVRRATFVPAAGDEAGQLKLFLNVEHHPFDAVLFADNRQSPTLGPVLAGAILSFNSWNSLAGTTELALFNSLGDSDGLDLEERNTVQLTQRVVLGENATMVEARALYSASAPGDELTPLGLTSKELEFGLSVEHPFMRTRSFSVWGAIGGTWTNSTSDLSSGVALSDDTMSVGWARLRALQRDEGGYTTASAELRGGFDVLGASEQGDLTLSRVGSSGEFTALRLSLERSQTLFDRFSLFGRATAQFTNDRLLVGEQITAGGGLYAKAYDPSEQSGDRGYMVYGELRYDQETTIQGEELGMQFYTFADYAELKLLDFNALPHSDLSSMGVGVRLRYDRTNLELEVAAPTGGALARNDSLAPRFYFSLTQRF
ncbi:MAG: hemolysin activation/secretion protein [Paracoccaceae bacterium]|jgi:hemolysin activation/secretion protein